VLQLAAGLRASTVFLGASVWCALSVSAGQLIAARAVMGLGAGIVFPLSLAVVSATFGDAERTKAIGILTAAIAAGLPLGPVLGGVLLQHFSWHSVRHLPGRTTPGPARQPPATASPPASTRR
jgi:MFS family permease